jgi:hypothetical protein
LVLVIEKLFNMMEKFTERIFNLENQTKIASDYTQSITQMTNLNKEG